MAKASNTVVARSMELRPEDLEQPFRVRWEYRQERGGASVDFLNELGDEGWELVNKEQGFLLFKRVKI